MNANLQLHLSSTCGDQGALEKIRISCKKCLILAGCFKKWNATFCTWVCGCLILLPGILFQDKIQTPISSVRIRSSHAIMILYTSQVTQLAHVEEWRHKVSVAGAYSMDFIIQLTAWCDWCNSCEVYLWKGGTSEGELIQYSRCALLYRVV